MNSKKILCVGGPWDGEAHSFDDEYLIRRNYYQYQCGWHKRTFIWVWKELLGENPTSEYWKMK